MGYHGFHRRLLAAVLVSLTFGLTMKAVAESRIKDLCEVQGARNNKLIGIGLVVGLAGTGDKTQATVRAQDRMLDRLDIDVPSMGGLKSDNIAVVVATAVVPPFVKEGTRIDVHVSSIYDCESLEGGTLLSTHLKGDDNEVYAVAQGPVSVGGFNVGAGGGTAVRKNHVTAGRVPMGAFIEREIPSTITDGERITLLLKRPDFTTADNIQEAINTMIGPDSAAAFGPGSVNVKIPKESRRDLVSFVARVQALEVASGAVASRVVINERTGTIVVGADVMIRPCQIAHGNLSIQVAITPVVSQPPPLSLLGETVIATVEELAVTEEEAFLMPVEGASAADVADALNRLKVTPRDMISIFQALRQAGALEADLEIM